MAVLYLCMVKIRYIRPQEYHTVPMYPSILRDDDETKNEIIPPDQIQKLIIII